MTHVRRRTAACLIVGWLIAYSSPEALAHSVSANEFNSLGSCAAMGSSVAEGVWQWCAKNEKNNMNGCKASFRSWVREVERTCDQRRREFGCSPNDHDAVEWHIHGWKRPGQKLSLHRAVQYCEDGTQGQAGRPGAGDAPPGLDRESRRRVQSALAVQGFDPGPPDGKFGPRTRRAIQAWQQANGHAATGDLTSRQAERLLAAASPPGASAAGAAGGLHGSIAFSQLDRGGYAYGIAWNAQGREAARRAALEECRRQDGGSSCHEAGWFANQCGALAIGDQNGYGTGGGETNAKAESSALSNCQAANRNCRVEVSRCVDGDYIRKEPVAMKPSGPEWSVVENQPCQVWNYGSAEEYEPFTWSGACVDGKASGEGRLNVSGIGASYQGSMAGGKPHGHGTLTLADGGRYEGEYREGKRHGRGTFTFSNGNRYQGEYRDGKPHGHGTYNFAGGSRYEGQWREGCLQNDRNEEKIWANTTAEACGFVDCSDLDGRKRALDREWNEFTSDVTDRFAQQFGISREEAKRVPLFDRLSNGLVVDAKILERRFEIERRSLELEYDLKHCE